MIIYFQLKSWTSSTKLNTTINEKDLYSQFSSNSLLFQLKEWLICRLTFKNLISSQVSLTIKNISSQVSLTIKIIYTPRNKVEGGYTGFTLFVRPSTVGVRMITWILFIRFQFFLHMYHLGEDLGRDWIWVSYLIKYVHNGWSCDLGIFGIPEVNFPARAFKLDIYRDLMGTHAKVLGFAEFQYFYFSRIFYAFLNEPGCSVMSALCPDNNLNVFIGFQFISDICITWVKILDGIEYEHHNSLNMCIMAGHVT